MPDPITPSEFADLSIPDQIKAVDDMAENMPYGVRPDRLEAYAGKSVWPFHADAGTGATKIYLADVQDQLQKTLRSGPSFRAKIEAEWAAARKVLERALKDFDWDAALKSGITEDVLSYVAAEIWSFLVENGGAVGRRRLQTLQCMAILNRSLITRAPPASTARSPDQ